MAETIPPPASDRIDDAGEYKPLAPLAIAAIAVAGFVGIALVTLVLVGLFTGKRVSELNLLFGALLGIGLSIAARWQVRRAEGTRTGLAMANLAWWISLVCGLTYGAYHLGTTISIRRQTQDFLDATWYDALQRRDFERAFYYTQSAVDRRNRSPKQVIERFEDTYSIFERMELIQLLKRCDGEFAIEPDDFVNQIETPAGLQLEQPFIVRTREGSMRCAIVAARTTDKEFEGPQYRAMVFTPSVRAGERRLSTYGRLLREIGFEGESVLQSWVYRQMPNSFVEFFLETQDIPKSERHERLMQYGGNIFLRNGLAAGTMPTGGIGNALSLAATFGDSQMNRQMYFGKQYSEFFGPNFMTFLKPKEAVSPVELDQMRHLILRGPNNLSVPPDVMNIEMNHQVEIRTDEVVVSIPIMVMLPAPRSCASNGRVYATLHGPEIIAELRRLRQLNWREVSNQEDTRHGRILESIRHHWTVSRLEVSLICNDDPRMSQPANPNMGPGPPGTRPKLPSGTGSIPSR